MLIHQYTAVLPKLSYEHPGYKASFPVNWFC